MIRVTVCINITTELLRLISLVCARIVFSTHSFNSQTAPAHAVAPRDSILVVTHTHTHTHTHTQTPSPDCILKICIRNVIHCPTEE
jgi:hypothetical protein